MWHVKAADQPTGPVGPPQPTGLTGVLDRSDRLEQPVDPETERKAEESVPTLAPGASEGPATPSTVEDEELVDYEASPECTNMEIYVVRFSDDCWAIPEEETSHLDFGPREAIFQKPKDSDNHLKALYKRGHINGKPVSRMLVDSGAIVNLMPYSLYKKLGGTDEELIKTNMMVSGIGGGDPIGAKGVVSMELTIGRKTIATTFFVFEVQDNFNLHTWT